MSNFLDISFSIYILYYLKPFPLLETNFFIDRWKYRNKLQGYKSSDDSKKRTKQEK